VAGKAASAMAVKTIIILFILLAPLAGMLSRQNLWSRMLARTERIIGEAPSKSLQPGAQLFLNHFSTAE
jgi:fumarate reductase subunit D